MTTRPEKRPDLRLVRANAFAVGAGVAMSIAVIGHLLDLTLSSLLFGGIAGSALAGWQACDRRRRHYRLKAEFLDTHYTNHIAELEKMMEESFAARERLIRACEDRDVRIANLRQSNDRMRRESMVRDTVPADGEGQAGNPEGGDH